MPIWSITMLCYLSLFAEEKRQQRRAFALTLPRKGGRDAAILVRLAPNSQFPMATSNCLTILAGFPRSAQRKRNHRKHKGGHKMLKESSSRMFVSSRQ